MAEKREAPVEEEDGKCKDREILEEMEWGEFERMRESEGGSEKKGKHAPPPKPSCSLAPSF